MKIIKPIFLLLITTYLLSVQSEIFGQFSKNLNNLNRSIDSLNEGHKKLIFMMTMKALLKTLLRQ